MTALSIYAKISVLIGWEFSMKFILSLFFILMANLVHAEERLPSSCKAVTLQEKSVALSTKKPVLAMIHNLSETDLWITHPVSEPSASAGWSSRLQAGNWSSLALDKESFELSCVESKPGHEQQVSCKAVIFVCLWPEVIIPVKQTGTFWAGENMNLSALMAYLGTRGFELPALTQ